MLNYIKLVVAGSIGFLLFFAYQYVSNLQDELTSAKQQLTALKISNETLKAQTEKLKTDLQTVRQLNKELHQKFVKAEQEKNKVIKIFSDHDFAMLVEKKPGLITRRMQKATQKVFREFEVLSNE